MRKYPHPTPKNVLKYENLNDNIRVSRNRPLCSLFLSLWLVRIPDIFIMTPFMHMANILTFTFFIPEAVGLRRIIYVYIYHDQG